MKTKRFLLFPLLLVVALVAQSTQKTFADTATSTTTGTIESSCGLTVADFAAISNIQKNASLDYLGEVKAELAARKSLLVKTILCAKESAATQQTVLNNIAVPDRFQNLKNQWLGRLDDAIAYYNLQLAKTDTVGINGTQTIAREVLAWRSNNYAMLAANVSHFILWSQNQSLFATADQRLAQIKNLINSPLFSENGDLQSDLQAAAVSLTTAENQNAAAENAFAQSLAPDQSLLLVQQSLNSLSITYQHFFDISTIVQSLLPQQDQN